VLDPLIALDNQSTNLKGCPLLYIVYMRQLGFVICNSYDKLGIVAHCWHKNVHLFSSVCLFFIRVLKNNEARPRTLTECHAHPCRLQQSYNCDPLLTFYFCHEVLTICCHSCLKKKKQQHSFEGVLLNDGEKMRIFHPKHNGLVRLTRRWYALCSSNH
jgi:hypothetical protein